ncbi:protein AKNAD1 isoform X3 [Oryzias latipes]|uniref:protein AKNAD1 isoform X3 n=1 Tax=Oryzias latipes TaxID=8090 RepID=UPI000CE16FD6|nr:protein AKNAD1 isoform X3 [Oryzias latipes]
MDRDSEESEEDVQEEGEASVLWERCFEQSIFVDLSEDESIHLSDLDNSLALHVSRAESAPSENSIHLSGSAELSALDDSPSESSRSNSNCENVTEGKTGSSKLPMSPQRPNTLQNELPQKPGCGESGGNTSDEDQEDLPYDGDIGSPYFNQTTSSEENSDGGNTVHGSPDPPAPLESFHKDANTDEEKSSAASEATWVAKPCSGLTNINHLLLQHFSQEDLLGSGRLIEAETLPEVSLLESVDDTVVSISASAENLRKQTESFEERSDSKSNNESSEVKTEMEIDHPTSNASASSNQSIQNANADLLELDDKKEDVRIQTVPLMRTRSLGEIKYGQGKVHYRLPDFSKVASKVKIPKAPSGPVKPVPPCSDSVHRAQSSPDILDVISRVLEDFVHPSEKPYVFNANDRQTPSVPLHHLQDHYDKLLTEYTTGENQKDTIRHGTKNQMLSENERNRLYVKDKKEEVECVENGLFHGSTPHLPTTENLCEQTGEKTENIKEGDSLLSNQHEDVQSDGERMTAELRDIISQFMHKTDEFKFSVTNMTVSTDEQQMILRSMMEAQDHLERKYMSKKEEHRALEMQNYMGLSRNTGTFDPNRQLEGDIFRIGMHLEDIKEMIDKNVYEQISLPHSSSTSTPITAQMKTVPFCTPSSPPHLHQEVKECFLKVSCETDSQEEEEEHQEMKNKREVHLNGEWIQSSEIIDDHVGLNICSSRDLLEEPDIQRDTEKLRASVFQEVIDDSNILGCLSAHSPESRGRRSAANSDLSPVRDQRDSLSLAVEVSFSSVALGDSDNHGLSGPSPPISCVSQMQRIISPETDSGFGSSYLTQSASGELNLLTGSEVTSGSDSEGSGYNPPTAIHYQTSGRRATPHQCVQTQHCGAEELWGESTTKESSLKLQGHFQLPHHKSEPTPRTTMDPGDRGSPLPSCSCNSEAILALQSEVSRLKKDLEEGLVQLPHLAKKMDYLTSKYGQEHQEHRSKIKSHQAAGSSRTSRRTLSELSSSLLRTEDWISSDMDPRKSTSSVRPNSSDLLLQMHDSPGGSKRAERHVCSTSEFHLSKHSRRGRAENSTFQREDELLFQDNDQQRPKAATRRFGSKERWSFRSASTLKKPLLQVHYGSTSSLPASYKVWEPQLQSVPLHRKRSTQSDTALLPSNMFFQQTLSPVSLSSRGTSKTSRCKGKKEVDMNRTLDQAIEVARSMKRTADRMARQLSADLVKAQQNRKLHNMQPLGGRTHLEF